MIYIYIYIRILLIYINILHSMKVLNMRESIEDVMFSVRDKGDAISKYLNQVAIPIVQASLENGVTSRVV